MRRVILTVWAFMFAAGAALARPLPNSGARSMALGDAYAADDEDINVLFQNPAGLAGLSDRQLTANYGRFNPGSIYSITEIHGAYGKPMEFKRLPVKLGPLGVAGGIHSQSIAPGVHIFDIVTGAGADVPTYGHVPWPVKGGAALKIRHQLGNKKDPTNVGKSSMDLGLDLGARIPFNNRVTMGFVLKDLYAGGGSPAGPQMRLGGRYEFPGLGMGLADMEIRKNVTAFHLGAEYYMWHKLLRLRAGNGFTSGGVDHVSLGAGFNFSPAQIDVAYAIPLKTFNDLSEQFRVSVVYRFGAPKFSELYLDRALDLAEDLDRKIAQLESKQSQLKDDVQNIEQAKRLAEDDWARQNAQHVETQRGLDERLLKAKVRAEEEEERMRSLEDKVRAAEEKIRRAERLSRAEAAKKDTGPKTYVVQSGDTLQSIAAKFYKDEDRWKDIFKANPDKVDRGRPVPGKTLVIP